MARFRNREVAGRELAQQLSKFQNESLVVTAIPNGGIVTGLSVAQALRSRLEVIPIRRLQISWAPKPIFGYVSISDDLHLNQPLIGQIRISQAEIYQIAKKERQQLEWDFKDWGIKPPSSFSQKTVLIIDDGMHSGWTMFSAIETARKLGASKIVAAVPVTHFRASRFIQNHCNEVISVVTEDLALYQIENYYEEFPDLSNEEIRGILQQVSPSPRQSAA